jgi:hypothetical protein
MRLTLLACAGPPVLAIMLTLAAGGCGFESRGLRDGLDAGGDGGARDGRPDVPPEVSTGTPPLPQAGGRSLAVWSSVGGGTASGAGATVGVTIACPATASGVTAPGGATVTIGHFADTLE